MTSLINNLVSSLLSYLSTKQIDDFVVRWGIVLLPTRKVDANAGTMIGSKSLTAIIQLHTWLSKKGAMQSRISQRVTIVQYQRKQS